MTRLLMLIITLGYLTTSFGQAVSPKEQWVEAKLQGMTLDEKIGQLFMIRAFSKNDPKHIADVKRQIQKYHVGGICFFQGSPEQQIELVNQYQSMSKLPMLVSMDAETGLGFRFKKEAISFPRQMTMGAINDHQLIYLMGKEVANQCKMTGITFNFAPVVDINNNPDNPVINTRSFGEDRYNVAAKAYAYMKGMDDGGIIACAKHFPGHGDTNVDSHYDLPMIEFPRKRLDSLELFPFEMLIHQGVPSVMVAHLQVPALDSRPFTPTTVSDRVVTGLLREEMQFGGLIVTDAMEMKGVTKHYAPGDADVAVLAAGNDIVLLPENIDKSIVQVKKAISEGTLQLENIEASVRRILGAKYDLGLNNAKGFATSTKSSIAEKLQNINAQVIKSKIYEKAITLVRNDQNILPIFQLSDLQFGSVSLGSDGITPFQKRMESYADIVHSYIGKKGSATDYAKTLDRLATKDIVFVSIHDMSQYSKKEFGVTQEQIQFVKDLSTRTKVMLTLFGSPYALRYFDGLPGVMVAYEEDEMAQDAAAQALFGAIDITGKLPVSGSEVYQVGTGISVPSLGRMGFALPEAVGLQSDTLQQIEELVAKMIEDKAAPGCQVLIAKDNKIVYNKAFGYHTYDKKNKVRLDDIYDVASVTKILASTISAMHLQDRGLFNLQDPVAKYIPEEDTTSKAPLLYEDLMAHVGGLAGWIPFYKYTLDLEKETMWSNDYYRTTPSDEFNVMVTPELYLRSDYPDTIWRKVFSSNLRSSNNYRYSDLAFYILNRTIENISGYQVDGYAEQHFYHPLGLRRTLFNPWRHFDLGSIPPTEDDRYWRNQVVQGTVHDMGAAMLGGVSGHAGLFSNSSDMAILMQMLLNNGNYGGRQYLQPRTIDYYTKRHWRSTRRGMGFDMKQLDKDKSLNMSELASHNTFGHLGFTGTAVFADPDYDLIYVFLSNRTYPTMKNNKFGRDNYRPKIQSLIYKSMIDG